MVMVNTLEAKTYLARLVDQASAGEEIIIARAGKPVARLVGLQTGTPPRELGKFRGQVHVPDDFDSMSDTDIPRIFGNGE